MLRRTSYRTRFKLRFREPVTYALFAEACLAIGVDVDKALYSPHEAIQGLSPSVPQLQAFLDVVLSRRVRLRKLPVDHAMALGDLAITDFFLTAWLKSLRRNVPASSRFFAKQGFPSRAGRRPFSAS